MRSTKPESEKKDHQSIENQVLLGGVQYSVIVQGDKIHLICPDESEIVPPHA